MALIEGRAIYFGPDGDEGNFPFELIVQDNGEPGAGVDVYDFDYNRNQNDYGFDLQPLLSAGHVEVMVQRQVSAGARFPDRAPRSVQPSGISLP